MKKEELFILTTFVNSKTFERIASGEQNEVLRVIYPSNKEVFIAKDDGDNVELVGYDAMKLVDFVNGLELLCEIKNIDIITLEAEDGNVYPYLIRGKEYKPEGLIYELGNVIEIEEDGTDK